jgi:hypothetical protein
MRTYQKHTARPMMSSLPRLSLPFPCQACSREKTFPATLSRFAAKPLILLGVVPELRKFSRYFPAGKGRFMPEPPRGIVQMRQFGKVEIPQSAFIAALKMGDG